MSTEISSERARMPLSLKLVLGFVYLQVVMNAFFGVMLQAEISDRASHNQQLDNPGLIYFAEYLSFVIAAALLVAAIVMTCGIDWARYLLVALEAIAGLSGLINLFSGAPLAAVGLVFAVLIIKTLFDDTVVAWFGLKAYRRRAH